MRVPELVPTWERLVELAGGGDVQARFLSMWCPPAYIGGCSQAVWLDPTGLAEPALVRNYDFAPLLLEASWLATHWNGMRVAAMGDCLWGALDGINEAGLTAALSFGGRQVSGAGFGIPLVLRYVLEVAQDTAQAVQLLQRLPVSMCYSVTLLDRHAKWATVFVAPDRPAEVTQHRAVTNLQGPIQWPEHARATQAVQRQDHLRGMMTEGWPLDNVIQAMLQQPMYQSGFMRGHGTLYGAVYRPQSGGISLVWPGQQWHQSLATFEPGHREVVFTRADRAAD